MGELVPGKHPKSFVRALPFMRLVVRGLMLLLGPVRVENANRLPKEGGVLLLANHLSDLDPIIVMYGAPRPIQFMAKHELFAMPVIGKIVAWGRAFPVKRGEPDRQSLKHAVTLLKAGEVVGIFPEGQLSETGELQELLGGVALIARMAEVPVICVGLQGTQRVIPYGRVIPRFSFRRVTMRWGEPRIFSRSASVEEILSWARDQLRELGGYK